MYMTASTTWTEWDFKKGEIDASFTIIYKLKLVNFYSLLLLQYAYNP